MPVTLGHELTRTGCTRPPARAARGEQNAYTCTEDTSVAVCSGEVQVALFGCFRPGLHGTFCRSRRDLAIPRVGTLDHEVIPSCAPARAARGEENAYTCTEDTNLAACSGVRKLHFSELSDPGSVEDFVDLGEI